MRNDDPQSPRARLKALLAIPERNRTEEEWNEINELEITLAPVNRRSDRPDQPVNGNAQGQQRRDDRGNEQQRGGGDRNQRHKPQNRKNRKPRNKPQGG